ncbi:PPC domain-containing DNA-binding protein [Patescibacteria group bacterium]
MKPVLREKRKVVLRLDSGEELISVIAEYAAKRGTHSAVFSAVGATCEIIISYYNVKKKKYQDKKIKSNLEVVSLSGNITMFKGEIIVHAHGVFSNSKFHTKGGHVKQLIVSPTCEVYIEEFKGRIDRKYSDHAGLNLME